MNVRLGSCVVIGALVVLVLVASAQAPTLPQAEPGLPQIHGNDAEMIQNQTTILITAVVVPIVTFLLNMWREGRNRQWDLQDRAKAREAAEADRHKQTELLMRDTEAKAEIVRQTAMQVKEDLRLETLRNRQTIQQTQRTLVEKIDKNTELSEGAFHAANTFNAKLEGMQQVFVQGQPARDLAQGVRDAAQLTRDTAQNVRDVAQGVRDIAQGKMGDQVDETHGVVTREFGPVAAKIDEVVEVATEAAASAKETLHEIKETTEETKDAIDRLANGP